MQRTTKLEAFEALASSLAMFECDMATGKINWASQSLEHMFGYEVHRELEGKLVEVLIPNDTREHHAKVHRPAFAANPYPRVKSRCVHGVKSNGVIFPVSVLLISASVEGDAVVLGIVTDLRETS